MSVLLLGFECLKKVKSFREGVVQGGEVGVDVGPRRKEEGGREERGMGLEIVVGFLQILFLGVHQLQSRRDGLRRRLHCRRCSFVLSEREKEDCEQFSLQIETTMTMNGRQVGSVLWFVFLNCRDWVAECKLQNHHEIENFVSESDWKIVNLGLWSFNVWADLFQSVS